ncbi:MAG: ParB N-terminal domain-containing protein [Thermodesulfobacteriota bacterium]|nr:ParB N-terminal domain-containing protein [Thermodesulfobacteriota bacterium]
MMQVSESTIPLSALDAADNRFRVSTTADKDDAALNRSIAEVGLLAPPLVRPGNGQGFQMVTGFRRLAVMRMHGHDAIPCRVLDAGTDDLSCLRMAVADNAAQRPLNLVEQARAVRKLAGFFESSSKLAVALDALGLPAGATVAKKLQAVETLPALVQDAVAREEIPLAVAVDLARLDDATAAALGAVFTSLRLGVNKQREVFTMVREIGAREKRSMLAVLQSQEIRDILGDPETDRGRKAARLRETLTKWRFPTISRTREAFNTAVREMKLGKNVDLHPPKDFESIHYTLQFRFKCMAELEAHKTDVDKILASESLRRLMDGK